MNKKRREDLSKASALLSKVEELVDAKLDEERDCLDNMPENLEYSDRYENIENAVDKLEDALSDIQSAISNIDEAIA